MHSRVSHEVLEYMTIFFSDVHAMNMATSTDPQSPVVVLSVSLSIVFLFGIGLTALLVILTLK